jgi:hypothetical protein
VRGIRVLRCVLIPGIWRGSRDEVRLGTAADLFTRVPRPAGWLGGASGGCLHLVTLERKRFPSDGLRPDSLPMIACAPGKAPERLLSG